MAKNDVVVKITQKQVAGSAGFGVPLIVQGMGTAAKEYAEYGSMDDVIEAGFEPESDIYKQCMKLFIQDGRPAKAAICVGTGKVTETLNQIRGKDFRQVIPIMGEGDDTLKDIASYVEAAGDMMLFIRVPSASALSGIGKMDRTVAIVYAGGDAGVEGALVGATAGLTVGSFTYKNIIIKGIAADPLTDAQIEAIHAAGGICIVRKAGDIVTSEGTVMSGEYADIIDSKDYVIRNIAYKSQKLLNSSPKLAFDNAGISQLEGVVTNVLKEASTMGCSGWDESGCPGYTPDFGTGGGPGEADRGVRFWCVGWGCFDRAGAIHYATISGTVEV